MTAPWHAGIAAHGIAGVREGMEKMAERQKQEIIDGRNVTADPERFQLWRMCQCIACEGTGKDDGPMGIKQGRCSECRGEGRQKELVATAASPEAIGVAIVTLGREGEWSDCPGVGLLDTAGARGEKWILLPFLPSPRNVSDAGRVLAKSKRKGKT